MEGILAVSTQQQKCYKFGTSGPLCLKMYMTLQQIWLSIELKNDIVDFL